MAAGHPRLIRGDQPLLLGVHALRGETLLSVILTATAPHPGGRHRAPAGDPTAVRQPGDQAPPSRRLAFVFRDGILDYQVATLAGGDVRARSTLEDVLWIRPVSVLVVGAVCLRLATRLRRGRCSTYVRGVALRGARLRRAGLHGRQRPVPAVDEDRPPRAGVVLLTLLFAVTRPAVRAHFARRALGENRRLLCDGRALIEPTGR
nr:hypothetical protein GCM10020241_01920 [Streptoalloteichus tenebrarius]